MKRHYKKFIVPRKLELCFGEAALHCEPIVVSSFGGATGGSSGLSHIAYRIDECSW